MYNFILINITTNKYLLISQLLLYKFLHSHKIDNENDDRAITKVIMRCNIIHRFTIPIINVQSLTPQLNMVVLELSEYQNQHI